MTTADIAQIVHTFLTKAISYKATAFKVQKWLDKEKGKWHVQTKVLKVCLKYLQFPVPVFSLRNLKLLQPLFDCGALQTYRRVIAY